MGFFNKIKITKINAYEILDSRGVPTIACDVTVGGKYKAKAMVPSGASTGEKEAIELRDGDKRRFSGKGVLKAVQNVNEIIAPALLGMDARDQAKIDEVMINLDGTDNKAKLGANSILSVSLGVAKAAALALKKPLYRYIREDILNISSNTYIMPVPMLNVINGGAHADNTLDFQEFMFVPVGAKSIKEACRISSECFYSLQSILKSKKMNTNKGDEGGFAPALKDADEALKLMVEAIKKAGFKPGKNADVAIALDPATSELYDNKTKLYTFKKALNAKILSKDKASFNSEKMIKYWEQLISNYPIISIEDGLSETDWDGFSKMTSLLGNKIQIVGDDLYCTNPKLTKKGIDLGATNSVLIKLNQIGTLTETIQTVKEAQDAGWTAVVSHRSGETEDTTIADLAVALSTGQIKTGSMSRSERIAKYNRLIEIENELGSKSTFNGHNAFKNISE